MNSANRTTLKEFINKESRPGVKLKKAIDDKHPLHYLYLELIEKLKVQI